MPEMPEVEQVRKTLLPHIKGKTIKNIEINLARLIKYPSPEEFIAGLTGKTILDVGRRGKYLVLKTGEKPEADCAFAHDRQPDCAGRRQAGTALCQN